MAGQFFKTIQTILSQEDITYETPVVAELIKKHFPDFRRVINELQRFSKFGKIDPGVLSQIVDVSLNDIITFIKLVKNLGFLIKVDTNGSQPKVLEKLIKEKLIDYVALDFKGPKEKFFAITKSDFYSQFISCFELLQNSSIPFEIRTTYHSSILNPEDIASMQNVLVELGYNKTYYIQNFRNYQNTIVPLTDSLALKEKDLIQNMTKIIFR